MPSFSDAAPNLPGSLSSDALSWPAITELTVFSSRSWRICVNVCPDVASALRRFAGTISPFSTHL